MTCLCEICPIPDGGVTRLAAFRCVGRCRPSGSKYLFPPRIPIWLTMFFFLFFFFICCISGFQKEKQSAKCEPVRPSRACNVGFTIYVELGQAVSRRGGPHLDFSHFSCWGGRVLPPRNSPSERIPPRLTTTPPNCKDKRCPGLIQRNINLSDRKQTCNHHPAQLRR